MTINLSENFVSKLNLGDELPNQRFAKYGHTVKKKSCSSLSNLMTEDVSCKPSSCNDLDDTSSSSNNEIPKKLRLKEMLTPEQREELLFVMRNFDRDSFKEERNLILRMFKNEILDQLPSAAEWGGEPGLEEEYMMNMLYECEPRPLPIDGEEVCNNIHYNEVDQDYHHQQFEENSNKCINANIEWSNQQTSMDLQELGSNELNVHDDEPPDENGSCSNHSTSASTFNARSDGSKVCDCCYCEVFGQGVPAAAPTSRNYAEMRERLRNRLNKKKANHNKDNQGASQSSFNQVSGLDPNELSKLDLEQLLIFVNGDKTQQVKKEKKASNARRKEKRKKKKAERLANAAGIEFCDLNSKPNKEETSKNQIEENSQFLIEKETLKQNKSNTKFERLDSCSSAEDVFLPKDIDIENENLDEFEKELEAFKRFCFNAVPLPRKEKINIDLKNVVIKKRAEPSWSFG